MKQTVHRICNVLGVPLAANKNWAVLCSILSPSLNLFLSSPLATRGLAGLDPLPRALPVSAIELRQRERRLCSGPSLPPFDCFFPSFSSCLREVTGQTAVGFWLRAVAFPSGWLSCPLRCQHLTYAPPSSSLPPSPVERRAVAVWAVCLAAGGLRDGIGGTGRREVLCATALPFALPHPILAACLPAYYVIIITLRGRSTSRRCRYMLARPDSYPVSPPHPSLSPECVVYAASAPDSTAVCLPAESHGFPWEAGVTSPTPPKAETAQAPSSTRWQAHRVGM